MWPSMTLDPSSFYKKYVYLQLKPSYKVLIWPDFEWKNNQEKFNFKLKSDLMWSTMTSEAVITECIIDIMWISIII